MSAKRRDNLNKWLSALFGLLTLALSSSCTGTAKDNDSSGQIDMSLEEYLKQGGEKWFLTGKRAYTVKAMMVSKETSFNNELEVTDYTVNDDGVTVILKGAVGEMWASKLPNVISTYTRPDGSTLSEEDFAVKDEYIDILARPEPDAYYAMHVPQGISVTVETEWGDVLHSNLPGAPHGEGDYIVCCADENGEPDLSDIWILNGAVFPKYYETNHISK